MGIGNEEAKFRDSVVLDSTELSRKAKSNQEEDHFSAALLLVLSQRVEKPEAKREQR